MLFAVYVADILETFIIPFQCSKPMVYVLYPAMRDIFFKLIGNFVKPKLLKSSEKTKDAHELAVIDIKNLDAIKTELKMAYLKINFSSTRAASSCKSYAS